MDLVEDGGQEDRGRRDIQGRQVERRFIRPVRGRQNWLTQALRWAAAPSWRRMAETNHDGCEQECGCWEEGFADALAGMQEWCSASTTFAGSVNYSCRFTSRS